MEQIQYINLFSYMLNTFTVILIILFFYGAVLKLFFILLTVLSYPTYLTLYALESFSYKKKDIKVKKIFRLNIPKQNSKRRIMNFSATIVTILLIDTAIKLFDLLLQPKFQIIYMQELSKINSIEQGIILIIAIAIIYIISFWTDNDERMADDKIESLSIPSLWKKLVT